MARKKPLMYCAFCRRDDRHVPTLVAGPGVFICGDCVTLAAKAIKREQTPDFAGFDSLDDDQLLAGLTPARAIAGQTDAAVGELVAILRKRGVSWSRVGEALGVTRQAAWERYSSLG